MLKRRIGLRVEAVLALVDKAMAKRSRKSWLQDGRSGYCHPVLLEKWGCRCLLSSHGIPSKDPTSIPFKYITLGEKLCNSSPHLHSRKKQAEARKHRNSLPTLKPETESERELSLI